MRHVLVRLAAEKTNKIRSACLRQTEPRSPFRALIDEAMQNDRLAADRNNGESQ
jgi:hypothetical protein